nr:immunoglobulin heavy chain junction region [Mus musculus]NSM04532.1 immunoglobulin heavy chain junction region [Mus musculus]NSM05256.1 immunoglobulin heavy chain junction region [Mus musculus]NSM05288.1 immunoglobulin heavy chain junction region [Mus musculus]NSM06174.1 immunoglobulin heavy chain junction region [Mus musculus]
CTTGWLSNAMDYW